MLSVKLYTKDELDMFMKREYGGGKNSYDIIVDNYLDIQSFFSSEQKDLWIVMEYRGLPEKIADHLALFTVKYLRKYYLQVIIPQDAGMELPAAVLNTITEFNMGSVDDGLINMKYDATLTDGNIGFRIICPRYTYADML